jgi:hypothetical protein
MGFQSLPDKSSEPMPESRTMPPFTQEKFIVNSTSASQRTTLGARVR